MSSTKTTNAAKLLQVFSIFGIVVATISFFPLIMELLYEIRGGYPFYMPSIIEAITFSIMIGGPMGLGLLFGIAYFIMGARLMKTKHVHRVTEEPTLENFHTPSRPSYLEKPTKTKRAKRDKPQEDKFCPNCGSKVPSNNKFCPYCGSAI